MWTCAEGLHTPQQGRLTLVELHPVNTTSSGGACTARQGRMGEGRGGGPLPAEEKAAPHTLPTWKPSRGCQCPGPSTAGRCQLRRRLGVSRAATTKHHTEGLPQARVREPSLEAQRNSWALQLRVQWLTGSLELLGGTSISASPQVLACQVSSVSQGSAASED